MVLAVLLGEPMLAHATETRLPRRPRGGYGRGVDRRWRRLPKVAGDEELLRRVRDQSEAALCPERRG